MLLLGPDEGPACRGVCHAALAAQAYHERVKHRTPAYWPTRILLMVGTIATVIVFALAVIDMLAEPPMFGPEATFLGLPGRVVQAALGVAVATGGLVWMLRIFRGPRDEAPAWRHRRR